MHFIDEYSGDLSHDNGHLTTHRRHSYNTTGIINNTQMCTSVLLCALHYTRDAVKDERICIVIFMPDNPLCADLIIMERYNTV